MFVECTSGVGECCADVVDGIAVGPVAGFLVDEYWVEKILEQRSVCVDGDGVERIYDCPSSVQSLDDH